VLAWKLAVTPGRGALAVDRVGGRNIVTRALASAPLRLLMPNNAGDAAWLFLATFGGGLLAGDHIELEVALAPGTTAMIGTQSQTKVFRGAGAAQTVRAEVGEGALLCWLPDPVCCFAGARFTQSLSVGGVGAHRPDGPGAGVAGPGDGSVVLLEGLTAGRSARGERWQFARFATRTRVAGSLDDALVLDPAHGELLARLGRWDALATVTALGPRAAAVADGMRAAAAAWPLRGAVRVALSEVAGGCVARVAGPGAQPVGRAVRELLGALPGVLGDDPFARKW